MHKVCEILSSHLKVSNKERISCCCATIYHSVARTCISATASIPSVILQSGPSCWVWTYFEVCEVSAVCVVSTGKCCLTHGSIALRCQFWSHKSCPTCLVSVCFASGAIHPMLLQTLQWLKLTVCSTERWSDFRQLRCSLPCSCIACCAGIKHACSH